MNPEFLVLHATTPRMMSCFDVLLHREFMKVSRMGKTRCRNILQIKQHVMSFKLDDLVRAEPA